LISHSNHCITEIIENWRNFPILSPSFSLDFDWRERERMNSRGLECEACLVHFKEIKGESEWI